MDEMANNTKVCWLDFGGDREVVAETLVKAGFRMVASEGDLQTWKAEPFPQVILELLNVDSLPSEPASKTQEVTASQVDAERREWCVPRQMDPSYRLAIHLLSLAPENQDNALCAVE